MPNNYQTTKLVRNYEEERARLLEAMYEVRLQLQLKARTMRHPPPCLRMYVLWLFLAC